MTARIYRPSKTAMQSGSANSRGWVLEFEQESMRAPDPLMGWTSSSDMRQQLRLKFASKQDAVAYAKRMGVAYYVVEPRDREPKSKSYADNFRYDRVGQWTH